MVRQTMKWEDYYDRFWDWADVNAKMDLSHFG